MDVLGQPISPVFKGQAGKKKKKKKKKKTTAWTV
jgi:hypothetical protein